MLSVMGQIGIEYIVLTIVILVGISAIFFYAYFNYIEISKSNQMTTAANNVINTINQVYAWGPGNVFFTSIDLPVGVLSVRVQHNCKITPPCADFNTVAYSDVVWRMKASGSDFFAVTSAKHPVDQNIPIGLTEGRHRVKVSWSGDWIHAEEG